MAVRKPFLKDKELDREPKKGKDREEGKERKDQDEDLQTPQRQIAFDGADEDAEEDTKPEPAENRQISTRRIWGKKGFATSKALYEIAATPQRVEKDQEEHHQPTERSSKHNVDQETRALLQQMQQLSIQMKQDLETLQSRGASSSEQILSQQEALTQQISKLTDVARRHDDEIDDMRAMQDYTHELVLEREQRENKHKMIIKSWPQSAGYSDRVRVTDWLLYKAQVQDNTKQEHGYYSANKKFTLSPVTILTFTDPEAHQRFERFAYTSFSTKWPLLYWDAQGNKEQHWKGGWHKLVITNFQGKTDLVINMTLTTAMQILTTHQDTGYAGTTQLSHRTTDKQIYDLEARKVITKATYDKDRGVVAIIAEKHLVEILRNFWHEAWKTAHKEHPRYPNYGRYPYAVTFAAARLDDKAQDQMEE
eukprot:Skav234639  [mRNA]  locus=scaffold1609:160726:161991:+ [translate_table: standard]